MVLLRCPDCGNVIDAVPGAHATCGRCGFSAPVPPAGPVPAAPAAAHPVYAPPPLPARPVAFGTQPFVTAAPPPIAGRPRHFWAEFFLGIVTLGVWYYIYDYQVFRDLDRHHGAPHSRGWFWAGVGVRIGALVVLLIATVFLVADAERRNAREVDPTPAQAAFTLVWLVGTAAYLGYQFSELSKLERHRERQGLVNRTTPVWLLVLLILGHVTLFIPTGIAYYLINKSANEVWASVYARHGVLVLT